MKEVRLTHREEEVLLKVIAQKSSTEIAHELHISKRTVDTHRKNIGRKLGNTHVVCYVKYAQTHGLNR